MATTVYESICVFDTICLSVNAFWLFRSLTPVDFDLSADSPSTPPTVRLRKKAYSDLSPVPIPLLSLSADEESPIKPPASSPANLTVETEDKQRVQRTHSLPGEKAEKILAEVPKVELSRKYSVNNQYLSWKVISQRRWNWDQRTRVYVAMNYRWVEFFGM